MDDRVLVTGGAGYIGSHTCLELLQAGCHVIVVDNLANSSAESLRRVAELAGRPVEFHQIDCCDRRALAAVVSASRPNACIHFAGLKAVGESVREPLRYYRTNLDATLTLLECLGDAGCHRLVFSSSATVYGDPESVPIPEDAPLRPTNPYGRTKLMIEEFLRDLCAAESSWNVILLRYFNPVGAHPSGRIGEDPQGVPNNLMPFISQVAVGRRSELQIFGGDWPTPDGTGVRDYIHVVDLAQGHLAALRALPRLPGCTPINLGTGTGISVLDVLHAMEAVVGRPIPHRIVDRRPGDVAASYANPARARDLLGWSACRDLSSMCADAWRWQSTNPTGYSTGP